MGRLECERMLSDSIQRRSLAKNVYNRGGEFILGVEKVRNCTNILFYSALPSHWIYPARGEMTDLMVNTHIRPASTVVKNADQALGNLPQVYLGSV